MGLTLSKQLTEMLNGELLVESAVNKGSRFFVKIKLNEIDNVNYIYETTFKKILDKGNESNVELTKLKGRVLVAEDNEDIQELVKLLLKKIGLEFVVVENGLQAVEAAMASSYDLVLLDIQMPVIDGFTAIKQLQLKGYKTPVIAMTANIMQKNHDKVIKSGFSGFISKPINKSELYALLQEYLKPGKLSGRVKTMLTSDLLHKEPDLIDLIDKFITRMPVMRDAINKAHTEQNEDELSNLIHQIKGVGGGYGYPLLTELCSNIEFQIEGQNAENVNELIKEFNVVVDRIIEGSDENHKIAEQAQP